MADWELIETEDQLPIGVVLSDLDPAWPPIEQGNQAAANLFWWPAISAICVVIRNSEPPGPGSNGGCLELWTRRPGEAVGWVLLDRSPDPFAGDHRIMAAYDPSGLGSIVLAIHDLDAGGYRFCKLAIGGEGEPFVWAEPYPGLDGSYFLVEPGTTPMMCQGTSGDPHPRLLGKFWDGGSYGFYSASFKPEAGGNGLYLHECSVPSERSDFAMDYDPIRDTIVICVGNDGVLTNDVWEGTGLTDEGYADVPWSGGGPTARAGTAMCHDGSGMLIYGGVDGDGGYRGRGGWRWNGTLWVAVGEETNSDDPVRGGGANNHFFRYQARLAYDPVRGVPVVFRGRQMD
jgi:hypothetical protein